jgi:hypothetical protein
MGKWLGQNQYNNLSILDRFLQKIQINGVSQCWQWKASLLKGRGYGKIGYQGRPQLAHRVSYMLYIGELEDNMAVCHRCDNENCVSPFHIFKGTQKENMKDAQDKGRMPVAKCPGIQSYKNGCRCDSCVNIYKEYHYISLKEWRIRNPDKVRIQNDRRNEKNMLKPKALEASLKNTILDA